VSQEKKGILEGRRERDLEKQYRSRFEEYEEWKSLQGEEPEVEAVPPKEEEKRKGCTKFDLLFLGLGFLVALLWRGCQGS